MTQYLWILCYWIRIWIYLIGPVNFKSTKVGAQSNVKKLNANVQMVKWCRHLSFTFILWI